jgi:hypothetical protein
MFITQREYDDLRADYDELVGDYRETIERLTREMSDLRYEHSRVMDAAAEEIRGLNKKLKKPCMYTFEIFCSKENVYIDAARVLLQDGQIKFFDAAGNIVGFVPATTIVRRWERGE